MTDLLLRAADPAADVAADPHAPQAQALLMRIVAEPRTVTRRRRRRAVRLGFAAAVAGAAAAIALVLPLTGGHGGGLTTAAYAVTRHDDGSFRVVVHWAQLRDPAALQAALDRAGAPVRVLTGEELPAGSRGPVPACAEPTSGLPYSARAVQWDFPDQASEVNGFVVRPAAFPRRGTLVIEVFFAPGSSVPTGSLSYMVIGRVPTCAQPVFAH